jgi:hypothetical protein
VLNDFFLAELQSSVFMAGNFHYLLLGVSIDRGFLFVAGTSGALFFREFERIVSIERIWRE